MKENKTIYMGGCSFLQIPNIFENECMKNYFGYDCKIINNATGGSSNDQIFKKAFFSILKNDFDFVLIGWTQVWRADRVIDVFDDFPRDEYTTLLKNESFAPILDTSHFYTQVVANNKHVNTHCKLEPEGTDWFIIYNIILHNLLNQKGIPHLFITMGEVIPETLKSRPGWLEYIDEKNYFGEGNLYDKIKFSITNNFHSQHKKMFGQNFKDNTYAHPESLIRDNACHLSVYGGKVLAEKILEYVTKNKIV